jgi:cobyrinic acid a,c-diamide synthase
MCETPLDIPRILIAALRGGSGKTLLSIGITAALRHSGKAVAPFKKGPDYIDAGWLALAAGRPCFNLDTFMCGDAAVCRSFFSRVMLPTGPGEATGAAATATAADVAVIEGNRGLYDGLDADGTTSTASLAKLLASPVILCLDCTKTTRTMAAVVMGCLHFDPDVMIRGVILNQVAGSRHEGILRRSIEQHCGIPVIGAVPKLRSQHFPERHMGLVPTPEHAWAMDAVNAIAHVVKDSVNLLDLVAIAESARGFSCPDFTLPFDSGESSQGLSHYPAGLPVSDSPDTNAILVSSLSPGPAVAPQLSTSSPKPENKDGVTAVQPESPYLIRTASSRPRIGVIRDAAFQFYYPENLEALEQAGADLVFFSPLQETSLPKIHALYIGGGFPETHAQSLSDNTTLNNDIRSAAAEGLPIYAECGGLMYLGESLVLDRTYPMAGVLPVVFGFSKKPQGHGYTIARVDRDTPYYPKGTTIRGHEFHYSKVLEWKGDHKTMAFAMEKGRGMLNRRDGICINNVLATYTHIHALGTPSWAPSLVHLAHMAHMGSNLDL